MVPASPPPPESGLGRSGLSLAQAIEVLVESLTIRKLSPATTKASQADLAAVTRLLPAHDGRWMVDGLTGLVLRTAFAAFAATDHAPASVARARSTWTALFDLLVAHSHLDGSPWPRSPGPSRRPAPPNRSWAGTKTPSNALTMFVMGGGRAGRTVWPELDRVIVALLLGTGLRSAELLGLNLGTYETASGDAFVRVIGKGSKPRTVPVPQPLPELIDGYLTSRQEKFPTWRRRRAGCRILNARVS